MKDLESEILRLRSEGLSIREIARILGVSKDKVYRVLKKYHATELREGKLDEKIRSYIAELCEHSKRINELVEKIYENNDFSKLRELGAELFYAENKLKAVAALIKNLDRELYDAANYLADYAPYIRQAIGAATKHSVSSVEELSLWLATYCGDDDMLRKFSTYLTTFVRIAQSLVRT